MSNSYKISFSVFLSVVFLAFSTLLVFFGRKENYEINKNSNFLILSLLLSMIAVAFVLISVGFATNGSLFGILIDERNRYSLSRIQLMSWSVTFFASLWTYFSLHICADSGEPIAGMLVNAVPSNLLIAVALAAFSTTAAPVILAFKHRGEGSRDTARPATTHRPSSPTSIPEDAPAPTERAAGGVITSKAAWLKIIAGEEEINAGVIAVCKMQWIVVTLMLVAVYIRSVVHALVTCDGRPTPVPDLPDGVVAILVVSHAAYLISKAAPNARGRRARDRASLLSNGSEGGERDDDRA